MTFKRRVYNLAMKEFARIVLSKRFGKPLNPMFLIYLIIGAFSGMLAGLLGLGGGIVIVPALATVFININ